MQSLRTKVDRFNSWLRQEYGLAANPTVAGGPPPAGRKLGIFLMGLPASGKTTLVNRRYGADPRFVIIDPDEIAKGLPGYNVTQPQRTHESAKAIAESRFEGAIASGHEFVLDGTATNAEKLRKRMRHAREHGYWVHLLYVTVPLGVSLLRNSLRERVVPEQVIREKAEEVKGSFEKVRHEFDSIEIFDTVEYAGGRRADYWVNRLTDYRFGSTMTKDDIPVVAKLTGIPESEVKLKDSTKESGRPNMVLVLPSFVREGARNPSSAGTPMSADAVYNEAMKELHAGDAAYTEIYRIRKSLFQPTHIGLGTWGRQGKPSEAQQARIKELQKVRSRHMARYKKLWAMLEWDETTKTYRLKGTANPGSPCPGCGKTVNPIPPPGDYKCGSCGHAVTVAGDKARNPLPRGLRVYRLKGAYQRLIVDNGQVAFLVPDVPGGWHGRGPFGGALSSATAAELTGSKLKKTMERIGLGDFTPVYRTQARNPADLSIQTRYWEETRDPKITRDAWARAYKGIKRLGVDPARAYITRGYWHSLEDVTTTARELKGVVLQWKSLTRGSRPLISNYVVFDPANVGEGRGELDRWAQPLANLVARKVDAAAVTEKSEALQREEWVAATKGDTGA